MSDDRLVHANITELRTDDATVANNAIEIIAEGTLRPELVPAVMRLGMPFAIRGMSRQDRSAYRDQLISADSATMSANRLAVWSANNERWAKHLAVLGTKRAHPATCGCVDPGSTP